jgi:hypothetical protein
MVKFAHLLVLSILIVWLAGSGCIGNDTSKTKEAGTGSNNAEVGNSSASIEDLEASLTQAELKELDSDMEDLEDLLENSSLGEDIIIEDVEVKRK